MYNVELCHPKSCYFTFDSKNIIMKGGPVWDFDYGALDTSNTCALKTQFIIMLCLNHQNLRVLLKQFGIKQTEL